MINVQKTINPNSLKFILTQTVNAGDKVSYEESKSCDCALALSIIVIPGVKKVVLKNNVISVSKLAKEDWGSLESKILLAIEENLIFHDPLFQETGSFPEYGEIKEVLSHQAIPYIQSHGGDLKLLSYKDNVLKIKYIGTCNSCPSAYMGTLRGITEILQEEYNPHIRVELEE